jgi:type I restriction enzyme R subunit
MAIAEWPTESGPADYALFVGLTCVAVIEAKRKRKNVSAAIDQAERLRAASPLRPERLLAALGRLFGFRFSSRPMAARP